MLAYGFFPSFFSVDASTDPYWQDKKKIENGRPFFKKYIPVIKKIAGAGWEPVTYASCNSEGIRIERFGGGGNLFFTVRNNGDRNSSCEITLDMKGLGLNGQITCLEMIEGVTAKVKGDKIILPVAAGRTKVISILLSK